MASNTFTLRVALDPATLVMLSHMADWEARAIPNFVLAMGRTVDIVEGEAQAWMWSHFINPTGRLENDFTKDVFGPYDAELVNMSLYGQRRNYGFSGMTDALGRYYPSDPGIEWAENAIANSYPKVEGVWFSAIDRTIAGL